jgi:hypothetical protein
MVCTTIWACFVLLGLVIGDRHDSNLETWLKCRKELRLKQLEIKAALDAKRTEHETVCKRYQDKGGR